MMSETDKFIEDILSNARGKAQSIIDEAETEAQKASEEAKTAAEKVAGERKHIYNHWQPHEKSRGNLDS